MGSEAAQPIRRFFRNLLVRVGGQYTDIAQTYDSTVAASYTSFPFASLWEPEIFPMISSLRMMQLLEDLLCRTTLHGQWRALRLRLNVRFELNQIENSHQFFAGLAREVEGVM